MNTPGPTALAQANQMAAVLQRRARGGVALFSRQRLIADSMERALGRGNLRRNPPVQEHDYCPFDW